jgi:hypothetical protein
MFGAFCNRSILFVAALVTLAASAPTALRGQELAVPRSHGWSGSPSSVSSDSLGSDDRASIGGPRARPIGVVTNVARESSDRPALQDRGTVSVGANAALIGVGAAAVGVGLLIGGDSGTVIAVGGGLLGLLGFYRFLK